MAVEEAEAEVEEEVVAEVQEKAAEEAAPDAEEVVVAVAVGAGQDVVQEAAPGMEADSSHADKEMEATKA